MNEKEFEKHDEKQAEEKQDEKFEEKYRSDPLGRIIGAAILIWAGVVFLANNLGYLEQLRPLVTWLPGGGEGWDWMVIPFLEPDALRIFLLGLAGIIIIEVLLRVTLPEYRRPVFGSIVVVGVILSIVYGSWTLIGPLILIAIGLSMLTRSWWRQNR
ncbi:hypothetical protein ACFLYP_01525 [Chloroflexota bacterium]